MSGSARPFFYVMRLWLSVHNGESCPLARESAEHRADTSLNPSNDQVLSKGSWVARQDEDQLLSFTVSCPATVRFHLHRRLEGAGPRTSLVIVSWTESPWELHLVIAKVVHLRICSTWSVSPSWR